MDKDFQFDVRHLTMDLCNLLDREFTGQNHTGEA
jgi:hypothetical protein